MHGQSLDYTPTKQRHIKGILTTCVYGLAPKEWSHDEVIFIDCTAGSGYTKDGQDGSPLIINAFAREKYQNHFKHLCCENDEETFVRLLSHKDKMQNVTITQGDYVDIVPQWLVEQNIKKPALGIVYCDANGARDLLHGLDMFCRIAHHRQWGRLDFLLHWSITAYNRNRGAGSEWADKHILRVTDELAALKKYAYIRQPVGKFRWIIMHLLGTDKIKSEWRAERIIKYSEWRENQGQDEQPGLFEGERK